MTWLEVMNNILTSVVQYAAIFFIGYLMSYLRKRLKTKQAKEALQMIEDAAKRAVTVTTQTFVDEVRKDGKLTKETAREAFDRAFAEVYMTANKDAIAIADKVTGDVASYIRQLIEEQVKLQKDEEA